MNKPSCQNYNEKASHYTFTSTALEKDHIIKKQHMQDSRSRITHSKGDTVVS